MPPCAAAKTRVAEQHEKSAIASRLLSLKNGPAHRQVQLTKPVLCNAIPGSHRHSERWCPKGLVFDNRLFGPLYSAHVV